jgi:demethylmenaquinone methyltransferase / 2-methoxy-6-polyprenyl-1,4-benzoquinol methylase
MNAASGNPPVTGEYVRGVFTRIAPHYDLMNRLMTGGQDRRWRREVIRRVRLPQQGYLLDLGTGTGDLVREALRQHPNCRPYASDFTLKMMQIGKNRRGAGPNWNAADALQLPYPANRFDGVVSGFLFRNVTDLPRTLAEQYRVLKPGGWMVALDTTQPQPNLLSPLIYFYMHRIIPLLGWVLTRQTDAYTYLPNSSEKFLRGEDLLARLVKAGFRETGFHRLMFGTIAIHWGQKPI